MISKNIVTAVSRAVNSESALICSDKLALNVWAQPSRCSPNGEKLKDGAIQRASVVPSGVNMTHTHMNPEKIGAFKRAEHNVKSSGLDSRHIDPWTTHTHRHKIARIYMPQRKHVHNHPTDKRPNNHWAIEFDSWGAYKSPLMGWTSASSDTYSGVAVRVARLQDAVGYCEAMGWGYDILYPNG